MTSQIDVDTDVRKVTERLIGLLQRNRRMQASLWGLRFLYFEVYEGAMVVITWQSSSEWMKSMLDCGDGG